MSKRWDEYGEDTTLNTASIVAIETNPSSTHAMKKITILNFIKSIFKQNLFENGASISNPPAGYVTVYSDANGFLATKDSSGNARRLNPVRLYHISLVPTKDTITVGDDKAHFDIPLDISGMNLVYLMACCDTVSSSGAISIMIRNVTDSVDMLSTALTIDENEKSSVTAATPYVIDGAYDDVVEGDTLSGDVDSAGTGAKGLRIVAGYQYP